jgi:hypothetical protein
MRNSGSAIAFFALFLGFAAQASACSWAVGYFHQVTSLKGRVVGKSLGPFQFRWLRRSFNVSKAKLDLYDYNEHWNKDNKPVAHTVANSAGEYDFGALKEGHYRLHVSGSDLSDWFDIEITNKVPTTKQITIDISPNFPDCTGGHDIEVQQEKK